MKATTTIEFSGSIAELQHLLESRLKGCLLLSAKIEAQEDSVSLSETAIKQIIEEKGKIAAIKHVRTETGKSLKDAKEYCDSIQAKYGL